MILIWPDIIYGFFWDSELAWEEWKGNDAWGSTQKIGKVLKRWDENTLELELYEQMTLKSTDLKFPRVLGWKTSYLLGQGAGRFKVFFDWRVTPRCKKSHRGPLSSKGEGEVCRKLVCWHQGAAKKSWLDQQGKVRQTHRPDGSFCTAGVGLGHHKTQKTNMKLSWNLKSCFFGRMNFCFSICSCSFQRNPSRRRTIMVALKVMAFSMWRKLPKVPRRYRWDDGNS